MRKKKFPDTESFEWFEGYSRKIIDKCKRVVDFVPGVTDNPVVVYVPGGDDKYPSFWIRDAIMQCRSGLIDLDEMEMMLRIILAYQNGPEVRPLQKGLRIDPWAIPDHINLPGLADPERGLESGAVFFPGSYNVGDEQGYGACGLRPADDDIYEVVELTDLILTHVEKIDAVEVLKREISGLPVIDRLHNAMQSMVIDAATGLCWNTEDDWAASSFHDELKPMGAVAISSVLRFRAAMSMSKFYEVLGDEKLQAEYQRMANQISQSVVSVLMQPSGWILAASEQNRQPDVWTTSMAICFKLLPKDKEQLACEALLSDYRKGEVSQFGYIRHVPVFGDAFPGENVWDHGRRFNDHGHYQNGGYWPQPLGYYVYALARIDVDAARDLAEEFINHTKENVDRGAPFEWINTDLGLEECRWYGPSVALPLEGFRKLSEMGF